MKVEFFSPQGHKDTNFGVQSSRFSVFFLWILKNSLKAEL